jgi:hypothetical protein
MKLNRALVLIVAALAGAILVSCSGAGGSASTISGRVFDRVTGNPVYGARVVCPGGQGTATTDANGIYRLTGSGTATGAFGVWKGTSYQFILLDNITVDYSASPVWDIALTPCSTASYSTFGITGTLPTASTANGRIFVRIHNSSGGWSDNQVSLGAAATSYTVQVMTRGSNCLAWVVYDTDTLDTTDPVNCYYDNLTIGTGTNTLNISAPSTTAVTVSGGVASQSFPTPLLMTSTYGPVGYLGGLTAFTGASKVVQVANPSGYPLIWSNMTEAAAGPYTFRRGAYSASVPLSTSVTLPTLPASSSDPGSEGGVMVWSHGSATLSFASVYGATLYVITVSDAGGHSGTIMTSRTVLNLPFDLGNEVLDLSASWDATLMPEWASMSSTGAILPLLKYWGPNGPSGLQGVQFSVARDGSTTTGIFP